jgi:hypothetical protein
MLVICLFTKCCSSVIWFTLSTFLHECYQCKVFLFLITMFHFPHHSCALQINPQCGSILRTLSIVNYLFLIAYIILPSCLNLSPTITLVNFLIWCPHLSINSKKILIVLEHPSSSVSLFYGWSRYFSKANFSCHQWP